MSYNPATDFLGLWRNTGGAVEKAEMPGLDFVVAALVRAGVLVATLSGTAPTADQPTTAWFDTAVPSYNAEGALFLWDDATGTYVAATPRLFFEFLQTSALQNGVSWWPITGGAPANTVGKDGDMSIRTDGVGGIYGPKAFGAWPANPLPGTTNTIDQSAMDATFGTDAGSLIVRNATNWASVPVGAAGQVFAVNNAGTLPQWRTLSALLDAIFSDAQGSILFRGADAWDALEPGLDDRVLTTHGAATDPSWTPKSSEFASGTRIAAFQQTTAPLGWTKDVTLNDYALRVVSGAASTHAGSAFSTVFAQTAVGNTTLSAAQMPSHTHGVNQTGNHPSWQPGNQTAMDTLSAVSSGSAGGDGAHTHAINMSLAYVDVIIATKN